MLRDEAVDIIADRLGNRTDLDTRIIAEMQLSQTMLEQTWGATDMPWFLLKELGEQASTSTVAGQERLEVPSDFLREPEGGALWVQDTDGTWSGLCKHDIDFLRKHESATGLPRGYALVGKYFRFYPTPDAAYSVRMLYYASDTVLSSNVTNSWLTYAPELLIASTGARIAYYIQDQQVAQLFLAQREIAFRAVISASIARDSANRQEFMGVE